MRSYYRTGGQVKRRKAAKKAKERKPDNMPARNKKNFRSTESGAGMTKKESQLTEGRTPEVSYRLL